MKDAEPSVSQAPEFLWDPVRTRILWANSAGLQVWGEHSASELPTRWFAPNDPIAAEIANLRSTGAGFIRLSPNGVSTVYFATAIEENGALRIVLNDFETTIRLEASQMSDGFELAPRPLAIFNAEGALITQNEADRLCFGPLSLSDRLGDTSAAVKALSVVLVDESFSKVFVVGVDYTRWRVNFRHLRGAAGDVSVLAEFTDLQTIPQEQGVDRKALAAIAHDFRTPLTAIRGFAEFLASGAAAPQRQADYLAAIQSAADGLSALADRIVTMGHESNGPLQLINLNELAKETSTLNEVTARNADMKITVSLDKGTNGVLGDPLATSRILQNLVSNAIRHSGGSAININVSDDQITVSDDGGGMDQTTLDRISTPNVTSGGGLGLVNCISLAQSTGATIRFATTPHNGFSAILSFAP